VAAAVVLRESGCATEREIREFAATKLADFKVPSHVRFVDEIPKGPTGKLQRIGLAERLGMTALNQNNREQRQTNASFIPPRTQMERVLAEIWAEVLGLDQVGIHDPFLDLGGHSLLASQIVARVYDRFHVELSPGSLLGTPTVAAMAELIFREQVALASAEDEG
jgi:acyl carrier protein